MRKALARQRRLMKFKKMGGAATKVARRGIVPATAYGNKVCGVSDAELGRIRTLIGKTIAPNTKGSSLALKLLLDGDPAADANAAPITKWAQVAWDAAAQVRIAAEDDNPLRVAGAPVAQHSEGARAAGVPGTQRCEMEEQSPSRSFRISQLNAAISYAQLETTDGSWETVSGPASATVLTTRRIGWRFKDGTTIIDERGKLVDMARTAPSCIRSAVERATRSACAAAAAHRWQRPEFRHGIWMKPVRAALGRLPPPAKAALRRTWMGGYWSRARLADGGLVDDAECDKCGCKRDDAYHRIWECQWDQIRDMRKTATTDEMRAEAARVSRDDWKFTRGLAPNPWATTQPPRADYNEVHVDGEMNELTEPLTVDGPAFVDGSALWPSDPDARRAGWSIVLVDARGDMKGAIFGHLPWGESDAQTAGQAEMYALRRAAELAVGNLHVFTDYKEAAEGIAKGEAATTAATVKHAAQWRAFWRAVDGTVPVVEKVKGHITEAEVAHDAELMWRRKGNALADRMAKRGAKEHYTADQWSEAKAIAAAQERHAELCAWIGAALGEWPTEKHVRRRPADRQAMLRRRQERRDAARLVGGHRVSWGRDGWKCQDCGKAARTAGGARRMMNQHCGGHITTRIPVQARGDPSAHILWTAEADDAQRQGGANVTWCAVCGAYSSTKLYKLSGPCGGPASAAARTRLRALQGLRHPVLGYRLKAPHRMTNLVMRFMVEQAAERRQKYADAMKCIPESSAGNEGHHDNCGDPAGQGTVAAVEAESAPMQRSESEEDVFGYGGELSEPGEEDACDAGTTNAAMRLVSDGHSAGGRPRTEPSGHVAASHMGATMGDDDTVTCGKLLTADSDTAMGCSDDDAGGNPATRLVHAGHSAGSGARTEPYGHVAAGARGTRVWEWREYYGAMRWVPASVRCSGNPCICDLQLTAEDVQKIRRGSGLKTADEVRAAGAKIVAERHERRRAERDAMRAEDKDYDDADGRGRSAKRHCAAGPVESTATTGGDEYRYYDGDKIRGGGDPVPRLVFTHSANRGLRAVPGGHAAAVTDAGGNGTTDGDGSALPRRGQVQGDMNRDEGKAGSPADAPERQRIRGRTPAEAIGDRDGEGGNDVGKTESGNRFLEDQPPPRRRISQKQHGWATVTDGKGKAAATPPASTLSAGSGGCRNDQRNGGLTHGREDSLDADNEPRILKKRRVACRLREAADVPIGGRSAEDGNGSRMVVRVCQTMPRSSATPSTHPSGVKMGGETGAAMSRQGTLAGMPPLPAAMQPPRHEGCAASVTTAEMRGMKRHREQADVEEEATFYRSRGELLRALIGQQRHAIGDAQAGKLKIHGEPASRGDGR